MIFDVITWNLDPEIFSIGNWGPRWYGIMFALAFLSGYLIFKRYLCSDKLTAEMLDQFISGSISSPSSGLSTGL